MGTAGLRAYLEVMLLSASDSVDDLSTESNLMPRSGVLGLSLLSPGLVVAGRLAKLVRDGFFEKDVLFKGDFSI